MFVFIISPGERYDFVINADQPVGAYWVQLRGLGECGIKRVQQLAILRYARGPYQPVAAAPTYDVGIPQGVVSSKFKPHLYVNSIPIRFSNRKRNMRIALDAAQFLRSRMHFACEKIALQCADTQMLIVFKCADNV